MTTSTSSDIAEQLGATRAALRDGRFREAVALAQQAAQQAEDEGAGSGHDSATAAALELEAWFRMINPERVAAMGDRVLAQFTMQSRDRELFDLLRFVSGSCSSLGRFAQALAHADRAERLAVELGSPDSMMMLARGAVATCFANAGNPWQAERLLVSALQLPGAKGLKREVAVVSANLGGARVQMFHLLRDAGRVEAAAQILDAAEQDHLRALAIAEALGEPAFRCVTHANLSEVCLQQRRLPEAEGHLAAARRLAATHGAETNWLARVDADLELAHGRVDDAIETAERMLTEHPSHPHRRFVHATLRDAYHQRGDLARALMHSDAAHRLDTQRLTTHLRAHSEYLVTRLEVDEAQRRAADAEIESRAQRVLAEALEQRVQERTAELRAANAALRDQIADRERAERVLREAQNELVQAGRLALLGQMSAAIAHEVNQPLTALRAVTDNCRRLLRDGRNAEVERNLAAIGDISARLCRITKQLKSFARKAPAGPVQSVRLLRVVNEALMLLRPRVLAEDVELTVDVAPEHRVRCEGYRLEQVMLNLVTNALDAMQDRPQRRLVISAEPQGSRVAVRVADTGAGLSDDARARLFEPFFTTKPPGEGLGLGLVLSSGIVREFGGTLRVVPQDEGTAFEFDLGLDEELAPTGAEQVG